jgi:hypothetical protein
MSRTLLLRLSAAAVLLAAAGLLVRVVPDGSIVVLQNHVGRSNPLLVSAGIHWRIPLWEGLYVYPRDPLPVRGEVPVVSRDGIHVSLPFEFRIRLDEEKALRAHRGRRSGEDAVAATRRMASESLVSAARRTAAYQLLRENLPATMGSFLRRDLDSLGLVEGSLKVGPGKVSAEILASFRPEKLAAMRKTTGSKVAIIGLDAADWNFAMPMIQRGELPNPYCGPPSPPGSLPTYTGSTTSWCWTPGRDRWSPSPASSAR